MRCAIYFNNFPCAGIAEIFLACLSFWRLHALLLPGWIGTWTWRQKFRFWHPRLHIIIAVSFPVRCLVALSSRKAFHCIISHSLLPFYDPKPILSLTFHAISAEVISSLVSYIKFITFLGIAPCFTWQSEAATHSRQKHQDEKWENVPLNEKLPSDVRHFHNKPLDVNLRQSC